MERISSLREHQSGSRAVESLNALIIEGIPECPDSRDVLLTLCNAEHKKILPQVHALLRQLTREEDKGIVATLLSNVEEMPALMYAAALRTTGHTIIEGQGNATLSRHLEDLLDTSPLDEEGKRRKKRGNFDTKILQQSALTSAAAAALPSERLISLICQNLRHNVMDDYLAYSYLFELIRFGHIDLVHEGLLVQIPQVPEFTAAPVFAHVMSQLAKSKANDKAIFLRPLITMAGSKNLITSLQALKKLSEFPFHDLATMRVDTASGPQSLNTVAALRVQVALNEKDQATRMLGYSVLAAISKLYTQNSKGGQSLVFEDSGYICAHHATSKTATKFEKSRAICAAIWSISKKHADNIGSVALQEIKSEEWLGPSAAEAAKIPRALVGRAVIDVPFVPNALKVTTAWAVRHPYQASGEVLTDIWSASLNFGKPAYPKLWNALMTCANSESAPSLFSPKLAAIKFLGLHAPTISDGNEDMMTEACEFLQEESFFSNEACQKAAQQSLTNLEQSLPSSLRTTLL